MPAAGRVFARLALTFTFLSFFPTMLPSQAPSAQTSSTAAIPPYGNCAAPQNAGVRVCYPFIFSSATSIASPLQLVASATGARGPVSNMQVWVDGVKVQQAYGSIFDAPVTLGSGNHQLTVVEVDSTGAYLKAAPISLTVENDTSHELCPPPGSPGVNACFPSASSSCHTAPWTTIVASATAASGTVSRMEVWVNGFKLANFPGNRINTNLYLPDFSTVTIVEVDSAGGFAKSPPLIIQSC